MPFDFATAKLLVRRTVHATFGVQAFYSDDVITIPVEFRARWHNRNARPMGGMDGDYAEVIEGIDHIVFFPETAKGQPLATKREGVVTFTALTGVEFILEYRMQPDGPLEEKWSVSRK